MAVRFNNYQPGAQFAAALDQADRQYQDKLALGWVPSERDPDQGIFGSFWDSFTSSAESSLGGALMSAGVMADSPWLAGLGGDVLRQSARYADWGNDYDDNPDKSRYSLGYFVDPHGFWSDAGVMMGSSAPGMLAGAALAAGTGGAAIPIIGGLGVLGSAGLEVGANFGQGYMDKKRDNIEAQIKAGQRPTGSVYDGNIDQAAWNDLTKDPWKNAELIGSSFMDTALDVATGATGGLVSLAGKGLAKAGLLDAMASGGGKVAGAILGDAARADTMLGRAAYGLSKAGRPLEFAGNRVANALGEGVQEAWQQRVQDSMGEGFGDDRDDAGSFFRDLANGNWDNFTDAEKNSFNAAFLPTLVSGVGVAGMRRAGQYAYNNIDALGPTFEAKGQYNNLMQSMGVANVLSDSTELNDFIGHQYSPENPITTHSEELLDAPTNNTNTLGNIFSDTPTAPVQAQPMAVPQAVTPTTQVEDNQGQAFDTQQVADSDPMNTLVTATRDRLQDAPDIIKRAYDKADIDAINKAIPEGEEKITPQMLSLAMQGNTKSANYILSHLDRKTVVSAIKERNQERKNQTKEAQQEINLAKDDLKKVIKGVGQKEDNEEAVQKAQAIIHSLAPNGKAEEMADKVKSRFLQVNQELLDRANNGDTRALRDVLRAVDPNAYIQANKQQEAAPVVPVEPTEDITDVPQTIEPTPTPVPQDTQNGANQGYSTTKPDVPQATSVTTPQPTGQVDSANFTGDNPPPSVPLSQNPNTKANVIAGLATPKGMIRARGILGKLRHAGYVEIPEPVRQLLIHNDTEAARAIAKNILEQVDDDAYNRVIDIDTGDDNNGTQTNKTTEGGTDNKTETGTETGGNPHQPGRLDGNETGDKTEGSETDGKQTEPKKVTPPAEKQPESKPEPKREEPKPKKTKPKPKKSKTEENDPLYKDEGGTPDAEAEDEVSSIDDDVDNAFADFDSALNSFNGEVDSRVPQAQQDTNTQPVIANKLVVQTSSDAEANEQFNWYKDNRLKPEMRNVIGRFYGTMNRMSMANLVNQIPSARAYISFIGGAHKFKTPQEELIARMQYLSVFGSLASLGLNLLRNRMALVNGANEQGIVDFNGDTQFKDGYADVIDIIPGAIHDAILTYNGLVKKAEGASKDVPSLNTYFYHVLNAHYNQYVTDRAGSGIILAETPQPRKSQIYTVNGDLLPDPDPKDTSGKLWFRKLYQMDPGYTPDELRPYGIEKFMDMIDWLTDLSRGNLNFDKTTGRNEITLAVQNQMVRGPYADKLRQLLAEADKNNDYSGEYGETFVKAFTKAFLDVVNTEEGRSAWDAYQSVQRLKEQVGENILKEIAAERKHLDPGIERYGVQTFDNLAFGYVTRDDGTTTRKADEEVKQYVSMAMNALRAKIQNQKNLTKEGKIVALNKATILLAALDLAEQVKTRQDTSASDEQAGYQNPNKRGPRMKDDDEDDAGDKSRDKTGGGLSHTNPDSGAQSIQYDYNTHPEPTMKRTANYDQAAVAARYMAITSFEIQLCNDVLGFGSLRQSQLLKRTNQDAAYLTSTEKAHLMIAFMYQTVLNNFGDISQSEFNQLAKSSDANDVRDYAKSLILKINKLFPTASTKAQGLEGLTVNMKNFETNFEKICEEIQTNPLGRKLFGLTPSRGIVSSATINGQRVNVLVNRRTPTFPWLNTKTSNKIMSADDFNDSKFVSNYIADNKMNVDYGVSDMIAIPSDANGYKRVDGKTYSHNLTTMGYSKSMVAGLNKFTEKWIDSIWDKCSKKKYPTIPADRTKYDKDRKEFKYRLGLAINKAKRGVLAVAMMGNNKYLPTDSSVALKLGFANQHGITPIDAILVSKALEQRIEDIANLFIQKQTIDPNRLMPGHRVVHDDATIYVNTYGHIENIAGSVNKRGMYAGEKTHKFKVSYNGGVYLVTEKEYKQLKQKKLKPADVCKPENQVTVAPRNTAARNVSEGKKKGEPNLIDNRTTEYYGKQEGSLGGDTNYSVDKTDTLLSSGTIVGEIDTLLYDYFRIDKSGIPNNSIVKALLVLDTKLPADTIIKNGLDAYIAQVAKDKKITVETARKQVMNQIKAAVNKFMKKEQLDIAAKARDDNRAKLFGTRFNSLTDTRITKIEGPSALRDAINLIAQQVREKEEAENKKQLEVTIKKPPIDFHYNEQHLPIIARGVAYQRMRQQIYNSLALMDYEGGYFKVKPLTIAKSAPINKIKDLSNINIHDCNSTMWTATQNVDLQENPIAFILQFMGSLQINDIYKNYGKDQELTFEDLIADPGYNPLMIDHNSLLLGAEGLVTSCHTFSYRLAQKDKLSYADISQLCSLFAMLALNTDRFNGARLEGKLKKIFDSLPQDKAMIEAYRIDPTNNSINLYTAIENPLTDEYVFNGPMFDNYNNEFKNLPALNVQGIRDIQVAREKVSPDELMQMKKENVEFLMAKFNPLNGNENNKFAHEMFINTARKVLGVLPFVGRYLKAGEFVPTQQSVEAATNRNTVYHELMHVYTEEATDIDIAKGRYRYMKQTDTKKQTPNFGHLRSDVNAQTLPMDDELRKEAMVAVTKAMQEELNASIKKLKKSKSLFGLQMLAITELVDTKKLIAPTVSLWLDSGVVGYDATKTGDNRFVIKLDAASLIHLYDKAATYKWEQLLLAMTLPGVIYGAKAVNKEIPLSMGVHTLVTETYSHLNNVVSQDSDFMTTWLQKSIELLTKLDEADPGRKLRNRIRQKNRDELYKNALIAIKTLTVADHQDVQKISDKQVSKTNEHAKVEKQKKEKRQPVGTGKGLTTNARNVADDVGSPKGKFMKALYGIANKRNKTFGQTTTSGINHAKDIRIAYKPGMRWLENFMEKEVADRLFDLSQRCIAQQQRLNAESDAYIKLLKQVLTIDGNKAQTKALREYFNTEINVNSDRGRDLVELFDLPYEAGQDERCKNRSADGKNAMLKVYADDVFFVMHNQPDKATAMAKMQDKVSKMEAYYRKKGKKFYKNQAFWYREDTGTVVFYACKDERMKDGKFKNLFISYPSKEDGTGALGNARMRARLQRSVMSECEQLRRKAMQNAGYAKPIIDSFIAGQALYRALLMNAYVREQKREMRNDDIINRTHTGFLHAYAPRYYARYVLQKETWHEIPKEQVKQQAVDSGYIVQKDGKYYHVVTYGIGSFENKSERARYRNEHPIGRNERYIEKTRDEWLQEQGGGRADIVGNVDTAIGTMTKDDIQKGKDQAETDIAGRLAKFIGKKFNDSEEWKGEDSIKQIVYQLEHMDEKDEAEFGTYKPRMIQTAKMIRVGKDRVQTFRQIRRALKIDGAQYLAANYSRERTSDSNLYSHDVIGSLQHYLHTVNSVEALTPFYREMTQAIKKYTGRDYDRIKRDSYYSEYNIMCELVDNMNGRDKPMDAFLRRLSVMTVDAIYAIPGVRKILDACGIYLPDLWLPAFLHNNIAINVYLKLGLFNVATGLAQYAQLANVYALGGEKAFAYAMKRMPGIMARAHNPKDILKHELDVSAYGKEIQQVMADMYLTKQGKSLLDQNNDKAFEEALKRGDKEAIELQVFAELFDTLKGKVDDTVMNDVAAQLGNAGSAYEGESVMDHLPKQGKQFFDLSMGMFRGADLSCRLFAALVAQYNIDNSPEYKQWREEHKKLGEQEYNAARMLEIRNFIYRTNFNFNRATDPLLVSKGGLLAKCVFQFASFGFQSFDFMGYLLRNKKQKELAKYLGVMVTLAGVTAGIPMMTMISGMCQAITGTNPEDWIKEFILEAAGRSGGRVPKAVAQGLCYGILAPVLGVDISKKVGLSDIMKDPTDIRNLGGPALGTIMDFGSAVGASYDAAMYDKYTTDQLMFAWLKSMPAASRWLQAARGQYYSYSKLMPKTEYQSMDNADRIKNALGFNPLENKLNTDINRYVTDQNQDYSNKVREAMIAYHNNPTDENLKVLQSYGKTPKQAELAVAKYIKPKVTAEQAESMVTKAKSDEANVVRSNVRALGGMLN